MYKSPLHILSDWDQDPESIAQPGYLQRMRKQWLAEFNLSNTSTIEIKGNSYSKDDIIKTIDQLLDNPALPLHLFIFTQKELLDFLENDDSKTTTRFIKELVVPVELSSTLNTLLLEPYKQKFKQAFASTDFDELNELWRTQPEFSEFQKEELYEDIHRHLNTLVNELLELPHLNIAEISDQFAFLKKKAMAVFLNALPEEFAALRDTFVGAVINALVAYQKTGWSHDKSYSYCVSLVLLEIRCDESLMQLIKTNHTIFTGNFNGETKKSDNGWIAKFIYVCIILGFFMVRNFSCEQKTHYDPHNALQNWPVKIVETEVQTFSSYRQYIISKGANTKPDRIMETDVYLDRSYSGRSPFLFVMEQENTAPDSSFKTVIIRNNTSKKLILTTLHANSADAFLFFPGQPDTLRYKPEDKLCFYFGDSLYRIKEALVMNDSPQGKNVSEIRFTSFDPMSLALFKKDFVLELKSDQGKKKTKKQNTLPQLILNEDFLITNFVETKQLKLYSIGSL